MEEVFVVLLESEGDSVCWAVCRTLEGAMGTVAAQMEEWRWYAKAAVQRMGVKP